MLYSLAEAAKKTALGEFTILRAIEDGRISGTKDLFGEWHVDEKDLRNFELANAEFAHGAVEDRAPINQIAAIIGNVGRNSDASSDSVSGTDLPQTSQELVPGCIGASGLSLTSSEKHAVRNVSLELQESRRISVRLAQSETGTHSRSTWDDEIRLGDREKILTRCRMVPVGRSGASQLRASCYLRSDGSQVRPHTIFFINR